MPNIWNNLKKILKDLAVFGTAEKVKPEPVTPIPQPIPVPKPIKPPEVDK